MCLRSLTLWAEATYYRARPGTAEAPPTEAPTSEALGGPDAVDVPVQAQQPRESVPR
jgi:hypothetical protein